MTQATAKQRRFLERLGANGTHLTDRRDLTTVEASREIDRLRAGRPALSLEALRTLMRLKVNYPERAEEFERALHGARINPEVTLQNADSVHLQFADLPDEVATSVAYPSGLADIVLEVAHQHF